MVLAKKGLGKRIKMARAEKSKIEGKKITQEVLAEELGISRSFLGDIERGRKSPNYEVLTKMANYFGVSTDYLLGNSPFKSDTEARQSISVAAMKTLLNDEASKLHGYDALIWKTALNNRKEKNRNYSDKSMQYITGLQKKAILTDLEYYDLFMFAFWDINWPPDFKGPAVLYLRNDNIISCDINYWSIPKILLDELERGLKIIDRPIKPSDLSPGLLDKNLMMDERQKVMHDAMEEAKDYIVDLDVKQKPKTTMFDNDIDFLNTWRNDLGSDNYAIYLKKLIKFSGLSYKEIVQACKNLDIHISQTYVKQLAKSEILPPDEEISEALAKAVNGDPQKLIWLGYIEKAPAQAQPIIRFYAEHWDLHAMIVSAFISVRQGKDIIPSDEMIAHWEHINHLSPEGKLDYVINRFNKEVLLNPQLFSYFWQQQGISKEKTNEQFNIIRDMPINRIPVIDVNEGEDSYNWVATNKIQFGEYVYFIVPDDSMIDSKIPKGAKLLCETVPTHKEQVSAQDEKREPSLITDTGAIYVVMHQGEILIRKVFVNPNQPILLQAENPKYPPIIVSDEAEFEPLAIVRSVEFDINN